MNQKVGMAESGMAIAEITVARQSRRKMKTTTTANMAPSIIASIELLYCDRVYSTLVPRGMNSTPGFSSSILSMISRASS